MSVSSLVAPGGGERRIWEEGESREKNRRGWRGRGGEEGEAEEGESMQSDRPSGLLKSVADWNTGSALHGALWIKVVPWLGRICGGSSRMCHWHSMNRRSGEMQF